MKIQLRSVGKLFGYLVIATFFLFVPRVCSAQTNYVFSSSFSGPSGWDPCFINRDASNNMFVSDLANRDIFKFGYNGSALGQLSNSGSKLLGVAVENSTGNLYVADYGNSQVIVYDSSGNYLKVFASGLYLPYGLAFSPKTGHLFVAYNYSQVAEFNSSGTIVQNYNCGSADSASLAFDGSGNLYVAGGSTSVSVFSPNGTLLRHIGSSSTLSQAIGVVLDSKGNIYVSDFGNSQIVEFTNSGTYVQTIGAGVLLTPYAIITDSNDNLFVADRGNKRIAVFTQAKPATISLSSMHTTGGTYSVGTILMSVPVPVTVTLALTSSNPNVVSVQPNIAIAAGIPSVLFAINTLPVTTAQNVTISAIYAGQTSSTTITVNPATLSSVSANPNPVSGGTTCTGTISFNGEVPSATTINLSSSNSTLVGVPATVTVPTGASSVTFPITSSPVSATQSVTITATSGTFTRSTSLSVTPPTVSKFTLSPTAVLGSTSATGTITLNGAVAQDTMISLSSANIAAAQVPASVTISAGSSSATFAVTTSPVTTTQTVQLAAGLGNATSTANLTVKAPTFTTFTLSPNPVTGGSSVTGTVTMSGPVAADTTVALSSTNSAVTLPTATVIIPKGQSSVNFTLTTTVPTTAKSGVIKATIGSLSLSVTLKVNP